MDRFAPEKEEELKNSFEMCDKNEKGEFPSFVRRLLAIHWIASVGITWIYSMDPSV